MTAKPLVQGSAFHEGKASWYLGKSEAKCIAIAMGIVEESKPEMKPEDYEDVQFRIPHLLHYWIEQFGKLDKQQYKVLAVEEELTVPIDGTEYVMTIRPDTIVKDKSNGLVFVMETKTSGFSHRVTGEAVYYGDQATAYLWGVKKMTGWEPYAVQPDIAYWNKVTKDLGNIKMIRPDLVFRDEFRLEKWEVSMGQLFNEMSQKAEAYRRGMDPWLLFPRNSHYCLSFSTACDFAEICGQDCERKGMKAPNGFWKKGGVRKLGGYVKDQFAAEY
jgi:hypothetical protein